MIAILVCAVLISFRGVPSSPSPKSFASPIGGIVVPIKRVRARLYRSAQASQLALPGFTFGLDIVLLVGSLRFRQHQTVDEVHQELTRRLSPLAVTISRREILFLFETYTTLLRAATEISQDADWINQVQANKGLILSVDGIQPDKEGRKYSGSRI